NSGYVGYSNYTVDLANPTPRLLNTNFPTLNRSTGFQLSFQLTLTSEASSANRSGFSLVVIANDKLGIELGFKGNEIFAQSNTFTAAESIATPLLGTTVNYTLSVQNDTYQLVANNAPVLNGSLRSYNFDPTQSQPPLPLNPYTLSNLLFLGDNTDQGRSTFTLGAVSVTPL
ncbi:MAG: calcium-binding protein, partial [Leptolyngbyaceae cyanobacterium SL_7_1]|nr:calcium-binding protein [Leptolyngbyaceae cyanobacterium SL_7_1]